MSAVLPKFDLKAFVATCREANTCTPDAPQLFKKEGHVVFLYDFYKRGFKNHTVVQNCKSLGPAYLRDRNYIMYVDKMSTVPAILPTYHDDELKGSIKGEAYIIPPETVTFLDMVRGNGINYSRKKFTIDLSSPYPIAPQSLEAWVYEGIPQAYSPMIREGYLEIGTRFKRKKNKAFLYYDFTKLEMRRKKA